MVKKISTHKVNILVYNDYYLLQLTEDGLEPKSILTFY